MLEKWNDYNIINENLQKALSILRRNNASPDSKDFKKLREILSKNIGYLGKFTEWLVIQKKSIDSLEELYRKIKSNNNKLSKPIDDFKTPEEVIDHIIRENAEVAVNQMVNAIPSKSRQLIKHGLCDDCNGDGIINCDDCGCEGFIDCECSNEEECGHCHYGQATCGDCEGRGSKDCENCNGDGNFTCDCGGSGLVDCEECKGSGCDDCEGEGVVTCEKCDGNGSIDCSNCDGSGGFDCESCNGDGTKECEHCKDKDDVCSICNGKFKVKCKVCNGKGEYKCESCKDGTSEWKSLLSFLKLHVDKKDIIIGFFSKKGGRYSDYDCEDVVNMVKKDIKSLVNIESIESIKKGLNEKENIRFIYENDEVFIIASNYEGLQTYGSSYWCITEDEDTFNDYLHDSDSEIKQQWIVYFKDKVPLVDNNSVMGVTINIINGDVSASHWEDDSSANYPLISIIFSEINTDVILNAESIYNRSEEEQFLLKFLQPEKNRSYIKKILLTSKPLIKNNIKVIKFETFLDVIGEEIIYQMDRDRASNTIENNDSLGFKLFKTIKSILKEEDVKFECDDLCDEIFIYDLKDYFVYNKDWNKDHYHADIFIQYVPQMFKSEDKQKEYIKWFIANGYDVSKHIKGDIPKILLDFNINDILFNNVENIDSWKNIDSSLSSKDKLYKKVFKEKKDYIIQDANLNKLNSFIIVFINWIIKNKTVKKYKKELIELIDSSQFKYSILSYIIDNIDDDDIEIACAHKAIHPKVYQKYNFDIKRKVMESIKSWREFNKI